MTISGFVVFGASYAITALTGAAILDSASRDDNGLHSYERAVREAVGRRMLVPVVGPFLAIDPAQRMTASVGLALSGVAQITGLVLGTLGAVRLARHRRRGRVQAHIQPGPDGGLVHVRLRF